MSTASSLSAPCILLMIRQRSIFLFFLDGCINLCCQVACLNNKPAYHRTVLNVMLINVACVHLAPTYSHFPTNHSLLKNLYFLSSFPCANHQELVMIMESLSGIFLGILCFPVTRLNHEAVCSTHCCHSLSGFKNPGLHSGNRELPALNEAECFQ